MHRTTFKPRGVQVSIRDLLTFSIGIAVGLGLFRTPLTTAFSEAELSHQFMVAAGVWLGLLIIGGIMGVLVAYFERRGKAERVNGFRFGRAMGISIPFLAAVGLVLWIELLTSV